MAVGAGAFPAGEGPAGLEPVQPLSEPNLLDPQNALLFDPNTRDFRLDPLTGLFVTVDPVDQEVVLALWIKKGSLGSVPGAGSSLRSIVRAGGPSLVSNVQDIVRTALKSLLDRKAIELVEISVTTPTRGQVLVVVSYTNLRLLPPRPVSSTPALLF